MSAVPRSMDDFYFQGARQHFNPVLSSCLSGCESTLDQFEAVFNKECGSLADKKLATEQVFKDVILQLIVQKEEKGAYEKVVNLSIDSSRKGFCNATLPVILLSDIFDCLTIDKCEDLFQFVESHVDTWKLELFFNSTKNNLLRICNDLLRRLSRSQNTVFCGRILLFLAKFFPLSERSGLNVVSEFNLENLTAYGVQDGSVMAADFGIEKDEETSDGDVESQKTLHVDYNLYHKFWSLQDFFRNPSQCYNKISWRGFTAHSDEVLKVFTSFELDDVKSARGCASSASINVANQQIYFAKYLTNPKLLDLQLNDSNFRRCVLAQFLILFQYLHSNVKFKLESYVLTDDQTQWMKNTADRIYNLLGQTPPEGATFAESIKHILEREEHWNHWKNDGCPEFAAPVGDSLGKPQRQKRKVGDEIRIATANKRVLLGNPTLTKLWNLCPNNMEACCSQKRDFLPSLESYFEEAIEQADPTNMIEDSYKHVHNGNYGWRALRLLARRSPHFFTQNNQPITKLPLYLETMIKRVAEELPTSVDDLKSSRVEKIDDGDGGEESEDELLKNSEEVLKEEATSNGKDEEPVPYGITDEQIELLAEKLGSDWKKIAVLLGCEEDEIVYYDSESNNPIEKGQKMLMVWRDNFPDKATASHFVDALCNADMKNVAAVVFKEEMEKASG